MLLVAMLIMQLFVKSQINGSNIFYFLSLAVRHESGWLKCLEFHSVLWHSLLGDTNDTRFWEPVPLISKQSFWNTWGIENLGNWLT